MANGSTASPARYGDNARDIAAPKGTLMGASKAKNSAKRRELNREKRARQAQRRAEREHPNAAAIAPVRARLDAVLELSLIHI